MEHLFLFDLPLKQPIPIFALLLGIALIFPLIFKKLKMPGIIGLIIAGMIFGPHGLNILQRDQSIVLLGSVGLIYIMFLAGLELDISQIKLNRTRSITFGVFTFIIPFIFGLFTSIYILNFNILASLLIALMFATHTLVAYPIASRLGIVSHISVAIAVGGTIITDTAVLLGLGIITKYSTGALDFWFWTKFLSSFALFSVTVLWGFPYLARWFFKNFDEENYSQFVFVFALVLLSAFLAEFIGIEGIIGAFFAGMALNRLIPHNSGLMSRIQFAGNALFIPFFLIGAGMLIDLKVVFHGFDTIKVAIVLTFLALFTKWFAAYLTQKIFSFSSIERNIIFGLSSSHVAATIAVILIGYNLKIIDATVLNSTVLLILVTCIVASFVTEFYGRKLALIEQSKQKKQEVQEQRILVPCSNPHNIDKLLDFAVACKSPGSETPIFPLTVMMDDDATEFNIHHHNNKIENYARMAYPNEHRITPTSRVDTNIADGIVRAVKEMLVNVVILGWNEKTKKSNAFFGRLIDNVLEHTAQSAFVCRLNQLSNITKRVHVAIQKYAEFEVGFESILALLNQFTKNAGAKVSFYAQQNTINAIKHQSRSNKIFLDANFHTIDSNDDYFTIPTHVGSEDIFLVFNARNKTVSYHSYVEDLVKYTARKYPAMNLIVAYPQQNPLVTAEDFMTYDVLDSSFIEENINVYTKIKRFFASMGNDKR